MDIAYMAFDRQRRPAIDIRLPQTQPVDVRAIQDSNQRSRIRNGHDRGA
jgi:hypothetical protein